MTIEKIRPRCFLDIEIDGQNTGRIIIELFADICPLTCDNFRALCTGEKGLGKTTDKPLHYKGVPFHRIVKNFIIQSGDFISGNGTGGESIYGGTFKDENFEVKHDKPFLLSMANKGKDTNGSQFFITTQPAPHLDGKHTVFGHVISGQQVVMEIENQKTTNSRPLKEVIIANCGELVLKMKQKAKKVRSESESSSSSRENERSRSKRKKRNSRKLEKKSKKEKREKPCPRVDSVLKYEESFDCSVDPDEIPEVPANNFLMRRSPVRDENQNRSSGRQSGFVFARKPALSRSGRKIKGRGLMRYRTPSPSGSRSGSETPPHWRQAQARVVPLDKVIKKVSKLDRSRSATPSAQDYFEQEAPQKADGIPLRQRLGRRINDVRTDEDEYGLRSISSHVHRSRNERESWESPRGRNDHSSNYRRDRHSVIEEDSDTSIESKSRHHSFRSMVVKADTEKHVHNDERDRRSRRSPPVRKERQRSPDHWQNRSDDLADIHTSRNQNLERNCRKGRFHKEITNKSSTAKLKHESVKEDRHSHRESNSRRSPRKIEHTSSRKSPSSKHKHSLSSDSDVDKRRKRKKETISERGSNRYHLDSHNSQQYSDNKPSQSTSKNAGELPRSQNDYKAIPKYGEPDVKNKIRKSSESETSINNSLKKTLAAYARDASVSSESENDNNEGNTAAANNKIIFVNSNELVTSSEEKYIEKDNSCTQNSVTPSDEIKSEMPENYSSIESLDHHQTSSSLIENDNSVTQCEKVLTDPASVTINEAKKMDAQSSRDDFVENQSDCKESQSKFPGSQTKTEELLESSDIQNFDHESSDKISEKPMEIYPISVQDEIAEVPESTSPPIEENEPIVTSSVENDKLIVEGAGNRLEGAKEVDYTCIPLDVIPLPEETAPFVSSQTDTEQVGEETRCIFAPSIETREFTAKVGSSGCIGKRDVISPKNIENRSRSSSLSSSAEIVPLAMEELLVGKDFHKNEEELLHIKEKKASSIRARALKAFSDEEKDAMLQQGDTSMITSILSLSHSEKNSQKSSGFKNRLKQVEKSGTDANEYIDYKFKGTEFPGVGESSSKAEEKTSMRSSSHSSAERMLKNVTSKSQSVEQKPSTSHYRGPSSSSTNHLQKSPRIHTSYSPRSDRRSRSIDLKSRSPVRSRRSPTSRRRRSPSPSPSRRDYQKSRSPILKSKSPRRRSRSSSRSISDRRSRSRSRSPIHRRYSRSPDRRYRRSWSRSYDGRSRFSRYPRLRNKSPNRQYSRPYGRGNERMRLNRRSSRSRSRSRSEMDHRRKRRHNRSSSSASSSRSSSSSSGDKKLSKKRNGKKKQRSSSSSSSSSSN